MLRKCVMFATLIMILAILTGCGPRKYTVNLNPNHFKDEYIEDNAISKDTPSLTFARGTYTDQRTNKELFGESKQYHILTDNEFSDAFYDGLKTFLDISHHSWSEPADSDVTIDVELLHTDSEMITGVWVVQFMSQVSTRITLIDAKSGEQIYQGTYEGIRRLRTPAGHESMFKKVVNESIVDCINDIGMDQKLHETFVARYQK